MTLNTICIILLFGFMAWENDRLEPKPYPLGSGDTLMVRRLGYDFCPPYCGVNHHHIGHFKSYNCETDSCQHRVIDEKWFRQITYGCMDVHYSIFHVLYICRLKIYGWFSPCIYYNGNGAR